MTIQIINVGTADNDGTGDKPKPAAIKMNTNFRELMQRPLAPPTRTDMMTDGDSKGIESRAALRWMAALKGIDMDFGSAANNLSVGGSNSGNGATHLTNATRMATAAAAVAAKVAAGKVVDMSLRMFTNDATSNISNEASKANLAIYHANLRAAGLRYLIVWGPHLRNAAADGDNLKNIGLEAKLRQYCEENWWDTIFIPCTDAWLDPNVANTNGRSLKYSETGTTGLTYGSVTRDGLHSSYYGDFRMWRPAWKALKGYYRQRHVPTFSQSAAYGSTALGGNLLGNNRRFVSLVTATNGITNNGSGSVLAAGQVPTGMTSNTLSGTVQAGTIGLTLATGVLPITDPEHVFPVSSGAGWPTLKLTLSGASDGAVTTYGCQIVFGGLPVGVTPNLVAGDVVRCGVALYLDGVQGLQGITLDGFSGLMSDSLGIKSMTGNPSPLAGGIPETITGPVLFEVDYTTTTTTSTANLSLTIAMAPGQTLAGDIHLIELYMHKL